MNKRRKKGKLENCWWKSISTGPPLLKVRKRGGDSLLQCKRGRKKGCFREGGRTTAGTHMVIQQARRPTAVGGGGKGGKERRGAEVVPISLGEKGERRAIL